MARTQLLALAAVLGILSACSGMGAGSSSGMPAAPQQAQAAPDGVPAAEPAEAGSAEAASPEASAPEPGAPGAKAPEAAAATTPAAPAHPLRRLSSVASNAIGAVTALNSPIKTYNDESSNEPNSTPKGKGTGVCHHGTEFFVPDRHGDPDSTETLNFYDAACTQLARDAVRTWVPGSLGSETVNRTVDNYRLGNTTPNSVRIETSQITGATFGNYGFPIVADGFQRETSSQLTIGNDRKNVLSDTETVMLPSTTGTNNYCTDSAGYNSVGIARLDETFGWQGGAFGSTPNTRTVNANGSVTWTSTHTGVVDEAPIGGLSIATGTFNTTCPIATGAYTLDGGTTKGDYTIPITVTYQYGVVTNLTVTNATLASGYTLNVKTNTNLAPSNQNFIQGTIASGSTQVASFDVTAYGNGILTIAKNNRDFTINDWNVVR